MPQRRLIALMLFVVFGALLWWALDSRPDPQSTAAVPVGVDPAVEGNPQAELQVSDTGGEGMQGLRTKDVELSAAAQDAEPACRVIGRLVDTEGRALPGEELVWRPYQPTATAQPPPVVVQTQEDGSFVLEVDPYPGPGLYLVLTPSPNVRRRAWHLGGAELPPLRPGTNDLGTMTCLSGHTVFGRVEDENHVGVAGALVTFGNGANNWSVRSDGQGHVAMHGLPPGTYETVAKRNGYARSADQKVVVGSQSPAGPSLWELRSVPPIAGRVVDEEGLPIEGAHLRWSAIERGTGWESAECDTDRDGRFRVDLRASGRHRVTIRHPEFRTWKSNPMQGSYQPGDTDVEFRLQRATLQTFQVYAKTTGAPWEHFTVTSNTPGQSSQRLDGQVHPGGTFRLQVAPGQTQLTIEASGFQTHRSTVAAQPSEVERIVLSPTWSVQGRVLMRGEPVPGASVVLQPVEWLPERSSSTQDGRMSEAARLALERVRQASTQTTNWRNLPSEVRVATTDSEGRFAIQELVDPSYRLVASVWGQASVTMPVEIGPGDLGEIELNPVGSIRGQLLLPPEFPPHMVRMHIGTLRRVTLSEQGEFFLPHVEPGEHAVQILPVPGVFEGLGAAGMKNPVIMVQPAEEAQAVIDLRDAGLASLPHLRLHLTLGGEPAEHLRLLWGIPGSDSRSSLGTTDSEGYLEVLAPPEPFELWSPAGLLPGIGTLDPVRDGFRPVHVDIPAGKLAIRLPDDLKLPEFGQFFLSLRATTPGSSVYGGVVALQIERHQALEHGLVGFYQGATYDANSRTILVRGIQPGEYSPFLNLSSKAGNGESSDAQDGEFPLDWQGKVTILERQTATWDLEDQGE